MEVEHAIEHAKAARAEGLTGVFAMAAQALAEEVFRLRNIAHSDDGAGGEGMRLYLEHRQMRAALERIAKYPRVSRDELGYEGCRQVAREALKTPN